MYKGHFHSWNIDDICITEIKPDYEITVRANDTLWGNVTPNTVLSIGSWAFYHMYLSSLSPSESLESIGSEAFACNSNMTGLLVIPQSVVSIGQGVFSGCGFTSLDWPVQMMGIPKSCFYGCRLQGTLSLLEGVTYEEDYVWGRFTNIIDDLDAVNELESDDFAVYPNPVADQLHVSCLCMNRVAVYDAQGRKIIMEAENEKACLDFSKQASGVYFVVVTTAEGRKKVSRIVKE